MAWQDRLRNVARNLAGVTAEALTDYADAPLAKGDLAFQGDDDQDDAPGGSHPDTAMDNPVPDEQSVDDPKSLFWDPFAIIEQLGYKERPSAVTYGTLKAMCWKTPIIQSVIQTRIQQMASFCQPSKDRYDMGFRVKVRDSTKEPSPEERKWIQQAETLVMRTGVTDNPRGRDTFEKFVRKLMWDSLVYDQMAFEVVPNRRGEPSEWYAVDASTIRLADTASTYLNEDNSEAVRYVQIYDGMIISEYTQEELCFGVRNPRTDIRLFGYGVSEMEMLMNVITAILFGWEYNQKAFSQGSSQKGVLNFKGAIPERQLKAFRRHWYQMISGVENAWRTPITNAEELQWISMQNSNKDMEYNAWFDFLIKIACAMYTIDPVEINFKYGNVGQRSGLNEAGNKEKITESKERGLRPLLRFIETNINQYIIWPLNESFEFKFVGLDSKTREEMADLNTKLVKTVRMVDELRAEDNLPPLPDGKGQLILDPTWLQFSSGKDAAAQQGMTGAPGEGAMPGADGQGDGMDFQQLLAEQEADEADEDSLNDEDEEMAEHQEATAKSLLRKSMAKARAKRLKLDLTL